jgi:hypothetical protein
LPNFRDKIQERYVELLAQAAARATPPVRPDLVDESRLCGSPGKIVDVGILDQLLRLSPEQQLVYGPGTGHALLLPVIPTTIETINAEISVRDETCM